MSKHDARVPAKYAALGARLMAEARWQGTTPEERSALMSAAGKKGGRPALTGKRCFCGATTMWRACSRNFDCCRHAGKITLQLKTDKDDQATQMETEPQVEL